MGIIGKPLQSSKGGLNFGGNRPKFGGGKGKFSYKPLTSEYMNERKNQSGSNRDPYLNPSLKNFSPQDGDNNLRIMPATWEGDSPYGLEIWVHYGIGSDRSTYLCLKMQKKACPICHEKDKAERGGDEELAKALEAKKRILMYVIDREKEGDGPKVWGMPFTLEREVAAQAQNKRTGEVIQFIDPEAGYDLSFTKKGKEKQTKYIGVSFDRDETPLSDDPETAQEWLNYISEHPLPEMLVFYSAEHIKEQFYGGASADNDGESKMGLKIGKKKEANELTWEGIHELDADGLEELATEKGLKKKWDKQEFESEEEAADWLCGELEIEKPAKGGKKGGLSLGGKKKEDAEEKSWDEVHAMSEEELVDFATEKEVKKMDQRFDNLEAAADYICEQLGIEKSGGGKKGGLSLGKKKEEKKEEPAEGELSWDDIKDASAEDLEEAIEAKGLAKKAAKEDFDDLDAAKKWFAAQLEIEVPEDKPAKKGGLLGKLKK